MGAQVFHIVGIGTIGPTAILGHFVPFIVRDTGFDPVQTVLRNVDAKRRDAAHRKCPALWYMNVKQVAKMPVYSQCKFGGQDNIVSQNIYDDPSFFAAYNQLPRSQLGLEGAPEWQSLKALLPAMSGLRVLDLGCGYGWFCRWARQADAAKVLGVDLSQAMLAEAIRRTNDDNITYQRDDLETLKIDDLGFDLVFSSLTFHYVQNVSGLFERIYNGLKPGGLLVFSAEHPIFTAPSSHQWLSDAQQKPVWPLNNYGREGKRVSNWLTEGVEKQHRKLSTYINELIATGFEIAHLDEWCPSDEQITDIPDTAIEIERPMFFLLAAQKPQ